MLKKIPEFFSPELMKTLMEMGHGDEIVIVDGNFPAYSINDRVVRIDGINTPALLKSILEFLPLDTFSDYNVFLMKPSDGHTPEIWSKYDEILSESGEDVRKKPLDRMEFYEKAKKAFAVITTSDLTHYACIILKKGVL